MNTDKLEKFLSPCWRGKLIFLKGVTGKKCMSFFSARPDSGIGWVWGKLRVRGN